MLGIVTHSTKTTTKGASRILLQPSSSYNNHHHYDSNNYCNDYGKYCNDYDSDDNNDQYHLVFTSTGSLLSHPEVTTHPIGSTNANNDGQNDLNINNNHNDHKKQKCQQPFYI